MYKPTKERIEELKAEHGDIFLMTVEDKAAIFKKPSRKALSRSYTVAKTDPFKSNEVLLVDCFVDGDRELLEVDAYFLGAQNQLPKIMEAKESSLEKL